MIVGPCGFVTFARGPVPACGSCSRCEAFEFAAWALAVSCVVMHMSTDPSTRANAKPTGAHKFLNKDVRHPRGSRLKPGPLRASPHRKRDLRNSRGPVLQNTRARIIVVISFKRQTSRLPCDLQSSSGNTNPSSGVIQITRTQENLVTHPRKTNQRGKTITWVRHVNPVRIAPRWP